MQSFLEKTADYIWQTYAEKISELCIVFPNRRAGLFFKKCLAEKISQPIWMPEIYSSEDFIKELSELEILDKWTLLFELYEIYQKGDNSEKETFDEFLKWGQIVLNDYNDIELYMIDSDSLFENLHDIKEIESWNLNTNSLTDFQKKYLQFWKALGNWHKQFNSSLLAKKKAYTGLAYHLVADKIEEKIKKKKWQKIIFAGFNALNKAEEKIFSNLKNAGKSEILWDSDTYYTDNEQQEAGKFIRKYLKNRSFNPSNETIFRWKENLLSNDPKSITIIGAAKNISQAKVAGDIISTTYTQKGNLENTAIVMSDESLLFPVLSSLPEEVKEVNVTMGYPLRNAPIYSLTELIFNLHKNRKKDRFYHKDVIKLFNHPLIRNILSVKSKEDISYIITDAIQKRNMVFVSIDNIKKYIDSGFQKEYQLLQNLFKSWNNIHDAMDCFYYIIDILKEHLFQENYSKKKTNLELEYIFTYAKIIKKIKSLILNYNYTGEIKTLHFIFRQIINSTSIPFYGEPLTGLQVMGLLETRTLDFETIIMLSVNENVLPSAKTHNTFIPYDIRRAFDLPTYRDRDAVFAYHFYRILQRAKNVYLIYNTEADTFGKGERSRFITQILHELPKTNKNVRIEEILLDLESKGNTGHNEIIIQKTSDIIKTIHAKGETGFSPSNLNIYTNCSLQFYFHAIAGLRETEEVEETIGADVLGTVIHEVLHKLYNPYQFKVLSADEVAGMKKLVESTTEEVFGKEFSSNELKYGKNLLTLKVAINFISNFLDSEIRFINENQASFKNLTIQSLEQELVSEIEIESVENKIKLKGKADRIDKLGDITRIIDYKTGIVMNKELNVSDWNMLISDSTLAKSFQLLMYAFLYQRNNPSIKNNLQSGIITFRELSAGIKPVTAESSKILNKDILQKFEHIVKKLLENIYNPAIPFTQTENIENCTYCNFKSICNRQ